MDSAMTPYDLAASIADESTGMTFEAQLYAHTQNGYVFIGPDFFIMGRPVDSKAPESQLCDLSFAFKREICDSWLVWLAAGDISSAMRFLPYFLPRVIFHRQGDLRVYETERFKSFLASEEFAFTKGVQGVRPAQFQPVQKPHSHGITTTASAADHSAHTPAPNDQDV